MISASSPRRITLDQLLRQNAQRAGDATALIDAPDRPLWTDGAPRRLSWTQVDDAVSAVAARFFEMGLPNEAVVCVQGLNISDTLIGLLGCMRAGLVPAMMPTGFDPDEIVLAAERLNAKAVLSARKIGQEQPLRALRHRIGASIADIRFVGAFGADLPGGVVSFEDCIGFAKSSGITRLSRRTDPEDNVALVTLDRGPNGIFAVMRSHLECNTAGVLFVEGLSLTRNARLLSTMTPTSLAGLASGLLPWLLSGCQLVLHQAFDTMVLGVQLGMHSVTHLVLPDTVRQALSAETLLRTKSLIVVGAITRAPHQLDTLANVGYATPTFAVLGEIGILPVLSYTGFKAKLPTFVASADGDVEPDTETRIGDDGLLDIRGSQIPSTGFDISEREALYPISPEGWISTGYPAAMIDDGVVVTGARFTAPLTEFVDETSPDAEAAQPQPTEKRALAGAA